MKSKMVLAATVLGTALVMGSTAPRRALGAEGSDATYVGNKTCKKCHLKQFKSWQKTKMAMSFEILKPDQRSEKKAAAELDPSKDYTTDPKCLKCHTVGFGAETGYQIPAPDDKKAQRRAAKLAGVGCECCHGPGSEYIKLHKEIQKQSRPYKQEERGAAGLNKIGPEVCEVCHNTESPFVGDDYKFDYEKRKEQGTHEHFPLKLRQE
jgi:cytochrome c5